MTKKPQSVRYFVLWLKKKLARAGGDVTQLTHGSLAERLGHVPRMLDLFCGRWGWSRAFATRGWKCVGVDLVEPPSAPVGSHFIKADIMDLLKDRHIDLWAVDEFDFICASSPCEEFSVHGMKHFHPNPKYPENGIRLFNHTREICEGSGVSYVMENVRAAQQFVGKAAHHCGPFYLWGSGVPPIMPQGINKKQSFRGFPGTEYKKAREAGEVKTYRNRYLQVKVREAVGITGTRRHWSDSEGRKEATAATATIPPELAHCVAEYAERLLEQRLAIADGTEQRETRS